MEKTRSKFSRHYSVDFIKKVLHVIETEGIYPTEVCRRFDITGESTVRYWIKKYRPNILPLQSTRKPIILESNQTSFRIKKKM